MTASAADAGSRWFRERLGDLPAEAAAADARAAVVETSMLEQGAMPPLHTRDRDESYHVLEGAVTFYVGNEVVRARAGDVVVAPAGAPRTFRVESPRARWLVMTVVRSLSRYEDFARAVARPSAVATGEAPTWPSADEEASLAAIAAANGIAVLGPPGMLPRSLARVASTGV